MLLFPLQLVRLLLKDDHAGNGCESGLMVDDDGDEDEDEDSRLIPEISPQDPLPLGKS